MCRSGFRKEQISGVYLHALLKVLSVLSADDTVLKKEGILLQKHQTTDFKSSSILAYRAQGCFLIE